VFYAYVPVSEHLFFKKKKAYCTYKLKKRESKSKWSKIAKSFEADLKNAIDVYVPLPVDDKGQFCPFFQKILITNLQLKHHFDLCW